MSKLISYREGRWATVRMDNGETCRLVMSNPGISVKKSTGRFFGAKLYEEKNIYRVAKTAKILRLLYADKLTPPGIRNWLLKSFVNVLLHCGSLSEAVGILTEVSGCLEGRTGEVSFFENLLSLSDRIRAEKGLARSHDIEVVTVSTILHMLSRMLPRAGQNQTKSSADLAYEISCALLSCFVASPLSTGLRQEGVEISAADIVGRSCATVFHLYEKDEVVRIISEGTQRYETLVDLAEEVPDIREFSDSVDRLVRSYVLSGSENYIVLLDRLYTFFLGSYAPLIQKYAQRSAGNKVKRRYKRFDVDGVDVRAKTLFAAEANLWNISMSGACVISKRSIRFGEKYLIKLGSGGTHLSIPCTVVWETSCIGPSKAGRKFLPVYRTGLAFSDMTSDRLVKLKDFIRLSGIPNEQRLGDEYRASALRFTVFTNEKAVLLYPKTSPVRKISLSGMLVESSSSDRIDRKIPMALFLPDEAPIRFRGRVASCIPIPDGRQTRFGIGIEFLDMEESGQSKVGRFLGLLGDKSVAARH